MLEPYAQKIRVDYMNQYINFNGRLYTLGFAVEKYMNKEAKIDDFLN